MNTMSHNNIDEASFLLSGRLSTIKKSQQLLFRYLLIHLSSSETKSCQELFKHE